MSIPNASNRKTGQHAPAYSSPLSVGIVMFASDLTLLSWNDQAQHISGYRFQEPAGADWTQLFSPVDLMQDILRKAQSGIPTLGAHVHLRHADGGMRPIVVQCAPQHPVSEAPREIALAFQEWGPSRPLHDFADHLAMLGPLAGILSHEIHNPLYAIFLHVDFLKEELQHPTPEGKSLAMESLTDIKKEITRLDEVIQDYLALARLTNIQRDPAELGALVEDLILEMEDQFTSRGIVLHRIDLEDLGCVALHHSTIRRAVLNLLQNAFEAMPEGGTLTLRGRREDAQVCLDIRDTGRGLSQAQLSQLFTPFYTTQSRGDGLGLYVVQAIIAAHDGRIEVASEPGIGTTFTLTLPLVETETSVTGLP